MKTLLLSRFPGGSMQIGAAGRKQAVKHVELRFTHPRQTTVWGAEFSKLRLSFVAPDGQVTDLELPCAQAQCFFGELYAESTQPSYVNKKSSGKKMNAAYAAVRGQRKRGTGFRQVRAAMKA